MTLKLYNTLTRQKEVFTPIDKDNVRMYVCGPTVYDYAHIGNARPIIVFDVLYRLLRHIYGKKHIKYVRNITDVDDKINARAEREGMKIAEVTERTTRQFHQDIAALGVLPPNVEPRATGHIDEMIDMIKTLIDKGHAYEADGHVLFHVPSMPDYGKLSNRSLDEMIAGARVEVASYKKDPTDFILWKPSTGNAPGWDSPWGTGRPGWHIECSAMSEKHLGKTFDIHGGGIDLAFPHHENEIAQSRCAHGTDVMAKVWMHNGFLQVEGEKMSKSLGNFITINELLNTKRFGGRKWPGEVLRLAMLKTRYRQPIDWTVKRLSEAQKQLDTWYRHLRTDVDGEVDSQFLAALEDDLNTIEAIKRLDVISREVNASSGGVSIEAQRKLRSSARLLGLLQSDHVEWFTGISKNLRNKVNILIEARNTARAEKNWTESDIIRGKLDAMGIVLKDGADGTTWEVKR